MIEYAEIHADEAKQQFGDICRLTIACVADGASIGFIDASDGDAIVRFWLGALESLERGERRIWLACHEGKVVGTVTLAQGMMPNGRHRAEVAKLMVHPQARRQGIARELMQRAEQAAWEKSLSLLVLDTRCGDPATALYLSLGWQIAGEIPDYAQSTLGAFDATTLMYKTAAPGIS